MKIYYFGCIERVGHYLWEPPGRHPLEQNPTTPWGPHPDGNLAPHENPKCRFVKQLGNCICIQTEGIAALNFKDGWTALSFWDRSVDTRRGCNSNFFAENIYTFEQMVEIAVQHFSVVTTRLRIPIIRYDEEKGLKSALQR